MKHRNSDTFAHWSKSLVALFLGVVVLTGCGKDGFKKKYDDEKAAKEELQKKLDAEKEKKKKRAKNVFFSDLGYWKIKSTAQLITYDNFLKIVNTSAIGDDAAGTARIDAILKEDNIDVEGAMKAFIEAENRVTSWFSNTELTERVGSILAVLNVMKKLEAKIDGKKDSYKAKDIKDILDAGEKELKEAAKYHAQGDNVVLNAGDTNKVDLLGKKKIKAAWEAFKKEVEEAQKAYENAIGVASSTDEKKDGKPEPAEDKNNGTTAS